MNKVEYPKYIWHTRSNTLQAGAILFGIDPKELCERLNCDSPTEVINKFAEARNKIKMLEDIGDQMYLELPQERSKYYDRDWTFAKKLCR